MQYENGCTFDIFYSRAYISYMDIATRLNAAMKDAGFEDNQSALSRVSRVPQPTINRILKGGGKRGPETETIKKLASACGVSFQWLMEGDVGNHAVEQPRTPYGVSDLAIEVAKAFDKMPPAERRVILRSIGLSDQTRDKDDRRTAERREGGIHRSTDFHRGQPHKANQAKSGKE